MAEKHREHSHFPAENELSLAVVRERIEHIVKNLEKFELEEKRQARAFLEQAKKFIKAEMKAPNEIKNADADAIQEVYQLLAQIEDLLQSIGNLI